jgi:hypothetical protein
LTTGADPTADDPSVRVHTFRGAAAVTPDLLRSSPFPHELVVDVTVDGASSVTASVRPAGFTVAIEKI